LGDPAALLQSIVASADDRSGTAPPLSEDEYLLLILDSPQALGEVTSIINDIPRGVLLVMPYPPDRELDWLTELIGPVASRLPPCPRLPAQALRGFAYADSALASDRPADEDALG